MLLRNERRFSFIAFVDEAEDPIGWRVLLCLLDPVTSHILEWLRVGGIIDEDDSICAFVVRFGEPSEPLLAGCVPNLQLDKLIVDVHGPALWDVYLKRKSIPMVEM